MDPVAPDASMTVSQANAMVDAAFLNTLASNAPPPPPSFNPHHPAVDCLPFKKTTSTWRVAYEMATRIRVKYTSDEWGMVAEVRNASGFYPYIARRMADTPYQLYKDDTMSPPRYYMDANTGPSNIGVHSSNDDAMSESDGEEAEEEEKEEEKEEDTNTHWETIKHLVEHRPYKRVVRYLALNFDTWVTSGMITTALKVRSENAGVARQQPKINDALKNTPYTMEKRPIRPGDRCYEYRLKRKGAKAVKVVQTSPRVVQPSKSSLSSSSTPPLADWTEDMVASKLFEDLPFLRDDADFVQALKSRRIKGKDLLLGSVRSGESLSYLLGLDELPDWTRMKRAVMRDQIYARVQEWKRI